MRAKVTLTFNIQSEAELDTINALFGAAGGEDPSVADSLELAKYLAAQDWVSDPVELVE